MLIPRRTNEAVRRIPTRNACSHEIFCPCISPDAVSPSASRTSPSRSRAPRFFEPENFKRGDT